MAPRLSDLPEELISNITCRLGDDKFALRATCRALEQKSFHEFATEHFSEKCVHLTTDSLKVLCDISSCPRLSKYVKKLSVITALFSEQSFTCPGSHAVAHWKPSVRQSEAYKFYMEDQRKLRTSGNDKLMLIEALSRLPSLKAVALIDSPDGLKDGTDYRGGNKVLRQTGMSPLCSAQRRCHTISYVCSRYLLIALRNAPDQRDELHGPSPIAGISQTPRTPMVDSHQRSCRCPRQVIARKVSYEALI
jgi:hypothetical protein